MEIKIRGLDPVIVKKFDEMAKIAVTPEIDELESSYQYIITKNI
ncbi:hypothetical protein [Bacillus sp. AFS055030]|nr:hypothetical protein [Bacillus sp. AFS055030]